VTLIRIIVVISSGPLLSDLDKLRSLAHEVALEVSPTQLLSGLLSQHYLLRIHISQWVHLDLGVVKGMMLSTILSLEFIAIVIVQSNATFGTKVAWVVSIIHC
jgi:hypothetical protein